MGITNTSKQKTQGRESIHGFSVFGAPIKTLVLDLEIILESLPVKNPNGGSIIDSRLNPLTFKIEKKESCSSTSFKKY